MVSLFPLLAVRSDASICDPASFQGCNGRRTPFQTARVAWLGGKAVVMLQPFTNLP